MDYVGALKPLLDRFGNEPTAHDRASTPSTRAPTAASWRRWPGTTPRCGSARRGGSTTAPRACAASVSASPRPPASPTRSGSTTTPARCSRSPPATTWPAGSMPAILAELVAEHRLERGRGRARWRTTSPTASPGEPFGSTPMSAIVLVGLMGAASRRSAGIVADAHSAARSSTVDLAIAARDGIDRPGALGAGRRGRLPPTRDRGSCLDALASGHDGRARRPGGVVLDPRRPRRARTPPSWCGSEPTRRPSPPGCRPAITGPCSATIPTADLADHGCGDGPTSTARSPTLVVDIDDLDARRRRTRLFST